MVDDGDYERRAFAALVDAVEHEGDFAGWLTAVMAAVTAQAGGIAALTQGRPGSWEAAYVESWMQSAGCHIDAAMQSHRAFAHELGGEA